MAVVIPMPSPSDRAPVTTGRAERYILRSLTGRALTETEAREVMPYIMEHKYFLSERLGRDVGLRVAAIDYFENIDRAHEMAA